MAVRSSRPDPAPSSTRAWVGIPIATALVVIVAAESATIVGGDRFVGPTGLLLVLLASAAWAFVASDSRTERGLHFVLVAIAVAYAIALVVPPRSSHDLWSYVMYGRIVGVHHASPYLHVPSEYRLDPFLGRVGSGWRHATSVYGPLFSAMSAALTRLAGVSVLRTRLAFQALAMISVFASLRLIWNTTHSARAVAFLGLHPAIVTAIVNGGHNDALVGLAVIAGAQLAARGRWYRSGFALGLGVLVKASGGLGLIGVGAWSLRRDRPGAARLVLAAGATAAAGYLPAGWAAVRAVGRAGNGNSHASVWDPISSAVHPTTTTMVVMVVALAFVAAFCWRTAARPDTTAVATLAAYLIGGVYVLPWYPAWALPAAALDRRARVSILVAVQAAFLVAVYEYELPAHPRLSGPWAVIRSVVLQAGAWAALIAFLALLVAAARVRGRAPARVNGRAPAPRRTTRS